MEARTLHERTGNMNGLLVNTVLLGNVLALQGKLHEAAERYQQVRETTAQGREYAIEATIRQASAARCLAGPASAANCGPTSRCRPGPVRPRLGQSACPAACPRPVSHARKRAAATQISQICSVSPTQPQLSEGVPNRDTARVLPGHRPSLSVMPSIDVASARRRLGAA